MAFIFKMEALRFCRPMVTDLQNLDEGRDRDPHLKSYPEPDPHKSGKRFLDPHAIRDVDPQPLGRTCHNTYGMMKLSAVCNAKPYFFGAFRVPAHLNV